MRCWVPLISPLPEPRVHAETFDHDCIDQGAPTSPCSPNAFLSPPSTHAGYTVNYSLQSISKLHFASGQIAVTCRRSVHLPPSAVPSTLHRELHWSASCIVLGCIINLFTASRPRTGGYLVPMRILS